MLHKKLDPEVESILMKELEEIVEAEKKGSRVSMFIEIEKEWKQYLFSKLIKNNLEENNTYPIGGLYHCYIQSINKESIQISFHKN